MVQPQCGHLSELARARSRPTLAHPPRLGQEGLKAESKEVILLQESEGHSGKLLSLQGPSQRFEVSGVHGNRMNML